MTKLVKGTENESITINLPLIQDIPGTMAVVIVYESGIRVLFKADEGKLDIHKIKAGKIKDCDIGLLEYFDIEE